MRMKSSAPAGSSAAPTRNQRAGEISASWPRRRLKPTPRTVASSGSPAASHQLPAEIPHVHVHHVALRIEVHVPYLLQERGPADDFLGVEQEVLEELELLGREVEPACR